MKDFLVSGDYFEILECVQCHVRLTSPKPAINDLSDYYKSENYIHHTRSRKSLFELVFQYAQRYMFHWKRKKIQCYLNDNSKTLLDIGSGSGLFIDYMSEYAWHCVGVEESKEAVANSKTHQMSEKEFLEHTGSYSLITLWHVLEHLWNIDEYLKQIVLNMNSDTLLLIAVPNYQSFDARYYKEYWDAYDVPRHLYHFSADSLERLLNSYNLEVVNKKQLPFDPFYAAILSEQKKNGSILRAIFVGLISFLNGLFDSKKSSSILFFIRKVSV